MLILTQTQQRKLNSCKSAREKMKWKAFYNFKYTIQEKYNNKLIQEGLEEMGIG
jgi:hypothetical protein